MWLYYFPRFLYIYNRLPQIRLQTLLSYVLEARYPKSRVRQGLFLLGSQKENVFYASLPASSGHWHSLACRYITTICLRLPMLFSMSVFTWPSHKDTSPWFRTLPYPVWSYLNYFHLQGPYFQIRSYSAVVGVGISTYLLGEHNSTHNNSIYSFCKYQL